MKLVPLSPEAIETLRRSEEAGVIVDFVALAPSLPEDAGETGHRRAAISGVADACRRISEEIAQNLAVADATPSERDAGTSAVSFWREAAHRALEYDPNLLTGQLISRTEFLGRAFEAGRLDHDRVALVSPIWDDELSFTQAFCRPPHGLSLDRQELDRLLGAVVDEVLGSPDESVVIWSWSTDWSVYFDAGHEWWGAALWTVEVDEDRFVTVLASTTD